jgi:hypothetical protein
MLLISFKIKLPYLYFWLLLLSNLFITSFALAALVEPLSNPKQYDQQKIQLRGFLYRSDSNQMVLSSQPGLRTCCVASLYNIDEQIFVKSQQTLEPEKQVVLLEGVFKIDPLQDKDGRYTQYYVLDDAVKIGNRSFPWLLVTGVIVLLLFAALLLKKK